MRFDAQRFSKISQLTAAALELSKEDLSLIESSVFSSGVFDKIYKYFKVIKCPHSLPSTMHYQNTTAETDFDKARKFNNFFSNVYNAKKEFFLPQGPISESISTRVNFTLDHVKSILGSLNVQKACGEDEVPNIFLNKLCEQLAPSVFC